MKQYSVYINGEIVVNYDEEIVNIHLDVIEGVLEVSVDCDGFEKSTKAYVDKLESFEIKMIDQEMEGIRLE
jgi:hypothetical protein